LRRILDKRKALALGDRRQLAQRRAPTEQVHGDHGSHAQAGAPGATHRLAYGAIRRKHRVKVDVAEDGTRARRRYGFGRRDERERRSDDGVFRSDAECAQTELDGVGSRCDSNCVPRTAGDGEPLLECLDAWPEHELPFACEARHRRERVLCHHRL
jgi:hypothetical protein